MIIFLDPVISTNGKYGIGNGPIYFSDVGCQGWELSLTACSKSSYLHFTCSNTAIAGTLCTDGKRKAEKEEGQNLIVIIIQVVQRVRFV